MTQYVYKVVPFIGKLKNGQGAHEVTKQLQEVIDSAARQGWEFYQLAETNIEISPGCIAGLFGAKESYVKFNQLIFRKGE